MILFTHVVIALLCAIFSIVTYISPSDQRLRISSILILLTLLSGTMLVLSLKTHLVRACMTGLVFVGFSLTALIASKHRLTTGLHADED